MTAENIRIENVIIRREKSELFKCILFTEHLGNSIHAFTEQFKNVYGVVWQHGIWIKP